MWKESRGLNTFWMHWIPLKTSVFHFPLEVAVEKRVRDETQLIWTGYNTGHVLVGNRFPQCTYLLEVIGSSSPEENHMMWYWLLWRPMLTCCTFHCNKCYTGISLSIPENALQHAVVSLGSKIMHIMKANLHILKTVSFHFNSCHGYEWNVMEWGYSTPAMDMNGT